jgi:predicted transcriptional regulator
VKKPAKPARSVQKPEKSSIAFSIRLSAEGRAALIEAGKAEERSAAWIAQRAVTQWLKTNGFLK